MIYKSIFSGAKKERLPMSLAQLRHITIAHRFKITDQFNRVVSVLLKTGHDYTATKESAAEYNERSIYQISNELMSSFGPTTLMLLKINQSVIDHQEWALHNKIVPKFYGHIMSGAFSLSSTTKHLNHIDGSLLSKVNSLENQFFESEKTILDKQLFTPEKQRKAIKYGSSEYYWFFEPIRLQFDLRPYTARVNFLTTENIPWNVNTAACGQAVHYALTSNKLGRNKSPQTAGIKSVFEILRNNDTAVIDSMQRAVTESNLSLQADEIDYVNSVNPESLNL